MPTVIPVKFKYVTHDLWFDPLKTGAEEGDHVICATERGQEIGLATMNAMEVSRDQLKDTIGNSRLSNVIRIATEEDLQKADELARRGDEALSVFRDAVHEEGLDMKPVSVEYLFDDNRAVCYFSAEDRVDFRQLVRELSRSLRKRVDMRQIGVREEAALIGGYAHCGQELCCARFGRQFEPVSIRMAKEQDLPLNTSKISGACGRLMCCLHYEFDAYKDFKQRAPKRNAVISTPLGKAKIVEYDTPKEQLCLRLENGKQVRIPLADMETSDAAVKKSQELHCPCRPDTVPRSALEKLESPEVQLALADLDRANGVTPPEAYDEADIFVESKGRHRRRSVQSGPELRGPGSDQRRRGSNGSTADNGNGNGGGRGRHLRGTSTADQAQGGDGATTKRTRRHRKRSEATPEQATAASAQKKETATTARDGAGSRPARVAGVPGNGMRRRRYHRGSGAEQGSRAQGAQGTQARSGSEAAKPQAEQGQRPRRRRHPGDHGGMQSQAQGAAQPRKQRPQQGGADQSGEGTDRPKRRRRRRGGRGHGGNGSGAEGGKPGGNGGPKPGSDA